MNTCGAHRKASSVITLGWLVGDKVSDWLGTHRVARPESWDLSASALSAMGSQGHAISSGIFNESCVWSPGP